MACKPLPILSNMPWHIQQKIAGFTDPYTQMNLQLCCKDLQKVVDKAPSVYEALEIYLRTKKIELVITSKFPGSVRQRRFSIFFEESGQKVLITKRSCGIERRVEVQGNFLDESVKYLEKIFYKTPRSLVAVRKAGLYLYRGDYRTEFIRKFQKLSVLGLLHIKNAELHMYTDQIASVLRNFHPGTLQAITLMCFKVGHPEILIPEVTVLEQWKKAQKFTCLCSGFSEPYDTWKHLEVEALQISYLSLAVLKDIIQRFAQSPTWKNISFLTSIAPDVRNYVNQLEKVPNKEDLKLFNVPNSGTEVIHLSLRRLSITVFKGSSNRNGHYFSRSF